MVGIYPPLARHQLLLGEKWVLALALPALPSSCQDVWLWLYSFVFLPSVERLVCFRVGNNTSSSISLIFCAVVMLLFSCRALCQKPGCQNFFCFFPGISQCFILGRDTLRYYYLCVRWCMGQLPKRQPPWRAESVCSYCNQGRKKISHPFVHPLASRREKKSSPHSVHLLTLEGISRYFDRRPLRACMGLQKRERGEA